MRFFKIITFILFAAMIISCKKPYTPAAVTAPNSYLVVEGVINIGTDSTNIKLSKTVNLSSGVTVNPVAGASITVESDQNATYALSEVTKGYYSVAGLNLDSTKKYRLRIKTADKKEYLSDFVEVKVTPPIDSIGYNQTSDGLQLYSNAHDPNNKTHYYRWDYNETWEFHSKYLSNYISNGTAIVPRTAAQNIYSCFGNSASSSILLGSSAKLAKDVIYQNPLVVIPATSEKIESKYSILLRQYALTTDAYNFWINLKKNTEQLGSIFDAQPSNINGNIHNIADASEPVIGYISASSVQTKRIFIVKEQLPTNWIVAYPYTCSLDSVWYHTPPDGKFNGVANILIPLPSSTIPTAPFISGSSSDIAGYLASSVLCVDCTLRGTKTRPIFWK